MQDSGFAKEYKDMEEEFEAIRASMENPMVDNLGMAEEKEKAKD